MVLSFDVIGDIYFYAVDGVQCPIDLGTYASSIKDTIDYVITFFSDPHCSYKDGPRDVLYALTEIVKFAYRNPYNANVKGLVDLVPKEMLTILEKLNNKVNGNLIKNKITPRDLFTRSSRYSVLYE